MGKEKKRSNEGVKVEDINDLLKQGRFDKLKVPTGFVGTFQDLFEMLLSSYGTIAIALHRFPPNQPSYIAILPPYESHVGIDDQVFVLLTGSPPISAANTPQQTTPLDRAFASPDRPMKFQFL
jgi:hypothetical protein